MARGPQRAERLLDQLERLVAILIPGVRRQEVARIGQAVGADRPQVRQAEQAAVIFGDIAPRRPVRQQHPEAHTARHQRHFAGAQVDAAHLGQQLQPPLLRDDQQLAIGVEEGAPLHVRTGARRCGPRRPRDPQARGSPSWWSARRRSRWARPAAPAGYHAAAHLVELDALEQRLEVASPKPSLPLRWMISKKIGPITFWVKICSSRPCPRSARRRSGCGASSALRSARRGRDALVEQVVIGVGRVLERNAARAQDVDRGVDVVVPSAMCWMPSPLYSRRNSSIWLLSSWLSFSGMRILPHGAGHRLGEQAGDLPLDVEVADLAEVEEPLVEVGPMRHPPRFTLWVRWSM
jgi:hypothetical protein